MKLILAAVAFVTFVFTVKPVIGPFIPQIDCMEPGIKGQKTHITCKIIPSAIPGSYYDSISLGMEFYRPDFRRVIHCTNKNDACFSKLGPRYVGVANHSRLSTVIIESFDPAVDAGEWICRDHPLPTRFDSCTKRDAASVRKTMSGKATSGACAQVASISMFIFWTIAILAANLQVTTSMYFN
ncbi:uncharacterized protein LOC121390610 [Gigantopelta aegis]|uniref:uncharacterized protein LOC121390610 n=1 Tax=Gigantopelta aegis TaxID=1735272 RepID=UPI001B88C3EE|nr:uncharacterized protein LOC121390610 [Gigantopelta aegis]